ncbi:MAG: hypothetical protein HFH59_06940 [Lachnospiraceae bacterium]|jgi:hypothetical protein|nr:hypothetical protein [Lachnospiraceae bacterium]MCI9357270.1 hypothetical protein [Lachnospiraceae bacterium]
MRESSVIEIVPVDGDMSIERVNAQLRSLILARERTIPGSRGFGLSGDYLDMPAYEAVSEFGVELEEKTDTYIPEIDIKEVRVNADIDGRTDAQIFVGWRDGYDSGDQ